MTKMRMHVMIVHRLASFEKNVFIVDAGCRCNDEVFDAR